MNYLDICDERYFMKLEMSKEELVEWCKIIVENNKT